MTCSWARTTAVPLGSLNPAAGNAAAIASKNKLSLVRSKQVLAIFAKHCLNETHAERVRGFRTSAHPAEDAWRDFLATECEGGEALEDVHAADTGTSGKPGTSRLSAQDQDSPPSLGVILRPLEPRDLRFVRCG